MRGENKPLNSLTLTAEKQKPIWGVRFDLLNLVLTYDIHVNVGSNREPY